MKWKNCRGWKWINGLSRGNGKSLLILCIVKGELEREEGTENAVMAGEDLRRVLLNERVFAGDNSG